MERRKFGIVKKITPEKPTKTGINAEIHLQAEKTGETKNRDW